MQKAAELAQQMMSEKRALYEQFQRIMLTTFEREGIHYAVNGHETNRLPHVLNVAFFGTNVEALLVNLDLAGIAASSGSACTAGSIDPSHVLVAMYGNDSERIRSSVRFSFGYGNTIEQVERAAYDIAKIVKRLTKA